MALALLVQQCRAKFDPYELNGGLACAVAGRDFAIVATDTRMIGEGGYQLLSRQRISDRMWMPQGGDDQPDLSQILSNGARSDVTNNSASKEKISSSSGSTSSLFEDYTQADFVSHDVHEPCPVWIASTGCSTDCTALKSTIQSELTAATYFGHSKSNDARQVANLLSQFLYLRRGFPFYSFCVVSGMSNDGRGGVAYCYDAIGSYEQVAVATGGTGRHLLQPILDQTFSSPASSALNSEDVRTRTMREAPSLARSTHVHCSVEEAVQNIVQGYRAVAEREIGVGDSLVLSVTQCIGTANSESEGDSTETIGRRCRILVVPLKEH